VINSDDKNIYQHEKTNTIEVTKESTSFKKSLVFVIFTLQKVGERSEQLQKIALQTRLVVWYKECFFIGCRADHDHLIYQKLEIFSTV